MSFLDKLKEKFSKKNNQAIYLSGFKKSQKDFEKKFTHLSKRFKGINDEFLEELTIALLESDIGIQTADLICEKLEAVSREYPIMSFDWAMNFVIETMAEIYREIPDIPIVMNESGPTVHLIVGVNGSGKTTSIAKLAYYYQKMGKKVAVVAGDTFRAGAVEQLKAWSEKLNIPCVAGKSEQDPSSVLVDGCRYALENQIDVLICDTAGRLQNKISLMNELAKMHKVIKREIEGAPHNVWLVLDGTTGQNGLSQAMVFDEATRLTGIILTKMDGSAKGGIVIAIKNKLKIPVNFIGLGESLDDLKEFDLDSYLYSLTSGLRNE